MRQLILHVGMHKTGTTSIQKSLDGLADGGVRYVNLANPNHTGPIGAAFSTEGQRGNRLRAGRTPEQLATVKKRTLERLHAELAQKEFHTFVISGEGIVFLPRAALRDLRDTVLKYVDRIQVFAYVREPVGFCSSAFQQRTKGGDATYKLEQAKYRMKFAPFVDVFGRENVSVKEFSRGSLRDGSVVVDFCSLWNIPFDPRREVRTNESLSEPAIKLLHLFNRSEIDSVGTRELMKARVGMIESLSGHFKGRFDLPARFRGAAIDLEDIDWLAEQFGIRFPVDPSIDLSVRPGEFAKYMEDIDPAIVDSYRAFLAGLGVPTGPDDTAIDLLKKHFKRCHDEALAQGRTLPALGRRLRARIRALGR